MIDLAIAEARKNPIQPRGRNSISRFAAVLSDGKQTFTAWNSYKTHPLQAKFGSNEQSIHQHCELAVIIKAIRCLSKQAGSHYSDITDLGGFRMAVARVLKDGTPALARPCIGCQRALEAFSIKDVEWTT